jgi:hypothetical protein
MRVESVNQLRDLVAASPDLQKQFQENPVAAIQSVTEGTPAYYGDHLVYRMVVAVLGLVVLIAAAGAIYLAANKIAMPDALVAFGSGSMGALAGMLAPSPGARRTS